MSSRAIVPLLEAALAARADLFEADPTRHEIAFHLFNGFLEGYPDLALDLYGRTLVVYNYAAPPRSIETALVALQCYLLERLPWVRALVLKTRFAAALRARRVRDPERPVRFWTPDRSGIV